MLQIDDISLELVRQNAIELGDERLGGIYFLLDGDEIVYVGQSEISPEWRVRQHIAQDSKRFDRFWTLSASVKDLDNIEATLILKFQPKYNHSIPVCSKYVLRTDLSYFYGLRNPLIDEMKEMGLITPYRIKRCVVFERREIESALKKIDPARLFTPGYLQDQNSESA